MKSQIIGCLNTISAKIYFPLDILYPNIFIYIMVLSVFCMEGGETSVEDRRQNFSYRKLLIWEKYF